MTVAEALAGAAAELSRSGVDTPRLDAELLLASVLGVERVDLLVHPERALTEDEARRYALLRDWRASRVPLPYLTGRREFFGRTFAVNQHVLIPRPETETLVEAVMDRLREGPPNPLILDVGTGSGCIAVSLALGLPSSLVIALDLSSRALEVARANAEALGAANVSFRHAAFPQGVDDLDGRLDALVSNPPYVGEEEAAILPPEVLDYEPREALFAADHGFAVLQDLLDHAPRLLKPGGLLALEVGFRQAPEVVRRAREGGLARVRTVRDLAGTERVVLAEAPAREP